MEKQREKQKPTNQTKKNHEKTQETIQRLWGNYKRYRDDTQSLSRMKRKILPKKTLLIKHSKTIHSRNDKNTTKISVKRYKLLLTLIAMLIETS